METKLRIEIEFQSLKQAEMFKLSFENAFHNTVKDKEAKGEYDCKII